MTRRVLSAEQVAAIRAAVPAPPVDDEQIAAVCEVMLTSRQRWQRETQRGG